MVIKKYEVTILHDSLKTKQFVYATFISICNGSVYFYIDEEISFVCPVQITIFKKLEFNKDITKEAAMVYNSLLKIC